MPTDDRAKAGLRGPVRRLEMAREAHGYVSTVEYDESGRTLISEWHNSDGSTGRTVTVYDDSGRAIRTESEYGGRKWISARYIHDGASLSRIEYFRADGGAVEQTEMRPMTDGGRVEISTLEARDPRGEDVEVGYDVTTMIPGARTRTTEFDSGNRKMAVSFYDAEHRLLSATKYVYDSDGRLIEETQTWGRTNPLEGMMNSGEGMPEAVRGALARILGEGARGYHATYRYDARGRRIERRQDHGTVGASLESTEYNDLDDVIRTVTETRNQKLHIGLEGLQREEEPSTTTVSEIEYEHDSHGNWTRRVMRTLTEGTDSAWHEMVERRQIDYFE